MKILINTASTFKGGGVQVALSFLQECKKIGKNEYHVILGEMLSELIREDEFPLNFSFYKIGYRPATRVLSLRSHSRYLKDLEKKINPHVVFTTSGPSYWRPMAPHLAGYNLPHYIYRDSPYFSKSGWLKTLKWDAKGLVIKHFFRRDADAYVVQTDDVNRRLQKWLNRDRVFTVSNTCAAHYLNPEAAANRLEEKKEGEFRFLTLSAWYPHKNLELIPKIADALSEAVRRRVKFILTLPGGQYRKIIPEQYRDDIINVGPVKPTQGPSLYKECDALLLPTLLECFSASYAEAMAMEKPIITSDLGFARSICKDAAIYAEPVNSSDYAWKIAELIQDTELQKRLTTQGKKRLIEFSTPAQRAEQYLDLCMKLVADSQGKS